jgi:imidazole glycerol-phosphate synthase subunit HisH
MVIIIDYNIGNIGSIVNMLKKIGVKAKLSSDKHEIASAERLILPGVGAFDNGMKNLNTSGFVEVLNKRVLEDKVPILGICLGMQLLMDSSEEGVEKGLGWISGEVKKFRFGENSDNLKVPHMGWNIVNPVNKNTLYKEFSEESRFYFVHSYHAVCKNRSNILAESNYGYKFTSSIYNGNIFGVQFHPEKSHKFGMKLLKNFSEMQ